MITVIFMLIGWIALLKDLDNHLKSYKSWAFFAIANKLHKRL